MAQRNSPKKILIIFSDFYPEISKNLLDGAKKVLQRENKKYELIRVDGTLEIPFVFEKNKKKYSGFIILGCVIQGETDHYEIVKNITLNHIYKLSYEESLPMSCAILTVKSYSQALDRSGKNKKNQGERSAKVCLNLIDLLDENKHNS
tara:strand:- start:1944 stop:2387 length:444 start_codon:yes stop_codon:yes gene_type:complete